MKISYHLYAGTAAGTLIYFVSGKNLQLTVSFIAANSLIDLDHFVDFWYDHRKLWDVKKMIKACYSANFRHFIVPLHSHELVILFAVIYTLGFRPPFFLGIVLGFALHIFMDQAHAGFSSKILFLFYRIRHKFLFDKIADPKKLALKRKQIEPYENIIK